MYQGKRAREAIIPGVQSQLFSAIRDLASGEEVWNRLEKLFQPRGLYREVALLEELTSIRFSDCPDMETYLNRKVTAAQRLRAINSEVKDRLLAGLILMKLPEEFNPLIQSISGRDDEITTDFVKERLLAEAARQKNQKQENALASRHFPSRHRTTFQRSARQGERAPGTAFRGKCNRCHKQGHMAKDCTSPKAQGKIAEVLPVDQLDRALRCSEDGSDGWYIDSGAGAHMSGDRDLFISLWETARGRSIATASNEILTCQGTGDVRITCVTGGKAQPVRLRDVMYVPGLSVNLISVKQLTGKGFSVNFNNNQRCEIKDSTGELCAEGWCSRGGLYRLNGCSIRSLLSESVEAPAAETTVEVPSRERPTNLSLATTTAETYQLWHRRLGHLHEEGIKRMANGLVNGVACKIPRRNTVCKACAEGKLRRLKFPRSVTKTDSRLELVHSDVCGPMETPSIGGHQYFVTFIADFSRMTTIYLLKSKSEVFDKIVEFTRAAERFTGCKLKTLSTDNGSEYLNDRVSSFLRENGIRHEKSVAYCPEQNGKAEIVNKILTEKARSMLADAKLDQSFWGEAISTACLLKNVSSTASLKDRCPEEAWTGRKPNLSYLRIFGCLAFAHVPKKKRKKWDKKAAEFIFVGYSRESKAYRLIDLNDRTSLVLSRDVVFDESVRAVESTGESEPPVSGNDDAIDDDLGQGIIIHSHRRTLEDDIQPNDDETSEADPDNSDHDTREETAKERDGAPEADDRQIGAAESQATEEADDLRRSDRSRRLPGWQKDYVCARETESRSPEGGIVEDLEAPTTIREALSGPYAEQWRSAMDQEMRSHNKNGTWINIERPLNEKVITSTWTFRIKKGKDGKSNIFKARLCARGCSQIQGVDFDENFSPVVKVVSLRTLFACSARNGWSVHQLDIETAYLHGELKERVLMETPEGYEKTGKICLLKKSMYGLRQAGRTWFEKLREVLTRTGL